MKIDAVLGVVIFPGITIGPQMTRPEFLQTPLGTTARLGVVNAGWVTLHVKPEPGVHGSLIFKDDRLIQLIVAMDLAGGEPVDWSKQSEMKREAQHVAWLKSDLGNPPYDYRWGNVSSGFDSKTGDSDVVISFGATPKTESWRDKKK